MVTDLLQSISEYLSQSGEGWEQMSHAMDNNPVVMTMIIVACVLLSLSFYLVSILLTTTLMAKGFFSTAHKKVGVWFILFLILVGTAFGSQLVTMFYPFYWIYSGILTATGTVALLTSILYVKNYRALSELPTARDIITMQKENVELKEKNKLLQDYIDVLCQKCELHVNSLKKEHSKLSVEVSDHLILRKEQKDSTDANTAGEPI